MPLYIEQSGDVDRCHGCLTDWLTTLKDRATQLLIRYKSGAFVTQLWTQPLGVKFGDDINVNFSVLKVSTRQQLSNQIFPSGDWSLAKQISFINMRISTLGAEHFAFVKSCENMGLQEFVVVLTNEIGRVPGQRGWGRGRSGLLSTLTLHRHPRGNLRREIEKIPYLLELSWI